MLSRLVPGGGVEDERLEIVGRVGRPPNVRPRAFRDAERSWHRSLKGKGVSAIGLTTSPAQTLSVATVAQQLQLDVPLMGNNPSFRPAILTPETADVLTNYYVVASTASYSSEVPKAKEVAKAYEASGNKAAPNVGIPLGYAIGEIWGQILRTACENDDLTRDGIQAAVEESTAISTNDLVADLDFSHPGSPATRAVYIARADIDTPGGISQQGPLFTSPDGDAYVAPHQKP